MSIVRIDTPDGPVSVISPIVDRLLDKGIVAERNGTLWGQSRKEVDKWVIELGVCDFCTAPNPSHIVVTPDFDMLGGGRSTGGWAACNECYILIIEDRRAELLQRAIVDAKAGKFSAAAIAALHRKFWQARDDLIEAAGTAAAMADYVEDRLPDCKPTITARERRLESVRSSGRRCRAT